MNVFERAIDNIETFGWTQHMYFNHAGQRCMQGALFNVEYWVADRSSMVSCPTDFDPVAYDILDDVIFQEFPFMVDGRPCHINYTQWNDQQGRTVEEVLTVLGKASARLNEQV